MKKIIRLTESDLTRIVKRILKESNDDPRMYHRYTDGGNPGIEKFFEEPLNDAIARELESQLENDEYANIDNPTNIGKGTRTMRIIFNGRKYTIDDFIDQVQEDGEANTCHTIDEYEYKNRLLGSTIITIKTDEGPCKRDKKNDPTPPKKEKKCKYDYVKVPYLRGELEAFQEYCIKNGMYRAIYDDGTSSKCDDADRVIGCCTKSCYAMSQSNMPTPRFGRD
jgi:hypothetical protein